MDWPFNIIYAPPCLLYLPVLRLDWFLLIHEVLHLLLLHLYLQTKAARQAIEKDTGVRHCILNELQYFDCVRFHIIDPMHNLLLGTAKHVINLWIKKEIICDKQFEDIQKCVDSFSLPNDIGRIPYKISSGISSFKADQWRSWIVIFHQ